MPPGVVWLVVTSRTSHTWWHVMGPLMKNQVQHSIIYLYNLILLIYHHEDVMIFRGLNQLTQATTSFTVYYFLNRRYKQSFVVGIF